MLPDTLTHVLNSTWIRDVGVAEGFNQKLATSNNSITFLLQSQAETQTLFLYSLPSVSTKISYHKPRKIHNVFVGQ
jgi:hypothetical protein